MGSSTSALSIDGVTQGADGLFCDQGSRSKDGDWRKNKGNADGLSRDQGSQSKNHDLRITI